MRDFELEIEYLLLKCRFYVENRNILVEHGGMLIENVGDLVGNEGSSLKMDFFVETETVQWKIGKSLKNQ